MSLCTTEEEAYKRFVREECPCICAEQDSVETFWGIPVVGSSGCWGIVQFCHNKHDGMGGAHAPVIGNGWPGCAGHHSESHSGRRDFEEKYGVNIEAECQKVLDAWENGASFV